MADSSQKRSRAKQDDSIMETNSSCIVSKRSVEKFYLGNSPDFTKYFVKKLQRRSPLINRGYWLRMKAIDHVTRCFLAQYPPSQPKAVVNLGCGFDSSPFKYLSMFQQRGTPVTENTLFVDIDYPKLMKRKCEIIQDTPALINLLHRVDYRPDSNPGIPLRSQEYRAVACDLTDTHTLEKILRNDVDLQDHAILFIAEVSLTYVEVNKANELIKLAATFDKSKFCLLEQCLADGPEHPFASTMLHHFRKLLSPLQAIERYPTMTHQQHRFKENNWVHVDAKSLWSVWNDDTWISPDERLHLDRIEPFDEWEEFVLFASHYFILEAYSLALKPSHSNSPSFKDNPAISIEKASDINVKVTFRESKSFRKQGAAFLAMERQVIHHGGQNMQGREGDYDVFEQALASSVNEQSRNPNPCPDSLLTEMPKLPVACHTITLAAQSDQLLVGGRSSPNQPSSSCFSLQNGVWNREASLPRGLFRHSAIALSDDPFGFSHDGVLVFGGKWSSTELSDEWLYWSKINGWRQVEVTGSRPMARFGASLVRDQRDIKHHHSETTGYLTGGIGTDGRVIEDFWTWTMYNKNGKLCVKCTDISKQLNFRYAGNPETTSFWRFGAYLVCLSSYIALVGGVSSSGAISTEVELLVIDESFNITKASVIDGWRPLPLLIGCSVVRVTSQDLLIMGGGATCFSFGSFWNKGCFNLEVMKANERKLGDVYTFSHHGFPLNVRELHGLNHQVTRGSESSVNGSGPPKIGPQANDIVRRKIKAEDDFGRILNDKTPVIIEDLYLGSCTKLWDLSYLRSRIGNDRPVVVHDSSSSRMNFIEKNFAYSTKNFGDFAEAIEQGHLLYLRSVSSVKPADRPTNFAQDFPTLADDFQLPPELEYVSTNMHSSPLRISGPVAMWLHYDVMANVLCQIRGEKRVMLFPPSEIAKLKFPPGASSSQLDVLQLFDSATPTNTKQGIQKSDVRAYVANLKPGDVLFIPSFWLHSAMPTEGISVAVNVFFRDMVDSSYATGKDTYGNRDLQAYENGRRDLARMVKPFNGLPEEARRFYLTRLAEELAQVARSCQMD